MSWGGEAVQAGSTRDTEPRPINSRGRANNDGGWSVAANSGYSLEFPKREAWGEQYQPEAQDQGLNESLLNSEKTLGEGVLQTGDSKGLASSLEQAPEEGKKGFLADSKANAKGQNLFDSIEEQLAYVEQLQAQATGDEPRAVTNIRYQQPENEYLLKRRMVTKNRYW